MRRRGGICKTIEQIVEEQKPSLQNLFLQNHRQTMSNLNEGAKNGETTEIICVSSVAPAPVLAESPTLAPELPSPLAASMFTQAKGLREAQKEEAARAVAMAKQLLDAEKRLADFIVDSRKRDERRAMEEKLKNKLVAFQNTARSLGDGVRSLACGEINENLVREVDAWRVMLGAVVEMRKELDALETFENEFVQKWNGSTEFSLQWLVQGAKEGSEMQNKRLATATQAMRDAAHKAIEENTRRHMELDALIVADGIKKDENIET